MRWSARLPREPAVERYGGARDHRGLPEQSQRRRLVFPGGSMGEYRFGKALGSFVKGVVIGQLGGSGRVMAENVLGVEGDGHVRKFRSDRISKSTRA